MNKNIEANPLRVLTEEDVATLAGKRFERLEIDDTDFTSNNYTLSTEFQLVDYTGVDIDNTLYVPVGLADGDTIIIKNNSTTDLRVSVNIPGVEGFDYIPNSTTYVPQKDSLVLTYFNNVFYRSANYLNTERFNISVNFIDVEQFIYVAPETFTINSIENPDTLTLTTKVNGSAYTLGTTISKFDDLTIDTDAAGFIILNCTR